MRLRRISSGSARRVRRFFASLLLALAAAPAAAQEVAVPMEVQFTVLAKALTFDRNLGNRLGSELVIAVVYQSAFRTSRTVKDEFLAAARASPIQSLEGRQLRVVAVDYSDPAALAEELARAGAQFVYVAPLRAVPLQPVLHASGRNLVLTGVPEYVRGGAALGVDLRGGRPSILINLPAARAAGADFGSQLLKLAQVIS